MYCADRFIWKPTEEKVWHAGLVNEQSCAAVLLQTVGGYDVSFSRLRAQHQTQWKFPLQGAIKWKNPTRCADITSVKSNLSLFAALGPQVTLTSVFLWLLRDIRYHFYRITTAMITRCAARGGQKYCSCCSRDTKQIRHSHGGEIATPEVHLAVNVGHWVRRRDILSVLSSPCWEGDLTVGDYYRRRARLYSLLWHVNITWNS